MKKFLLNLFGWLATPCLFAAYYFTKEPAFIFIYGALAVVMFILVIIMLLGIGYMYVEKNEAYETAMITAGSQISKLKMAQGHVYLLGAIVALAFWHFYWLAAFMILYYFLMMFFWHIMKTESVRLKAEVAKQ